ncbi:TPA: hypothetical protein NV753_001633 [Escherichia coli]|nr:hypothetical protein [Escherichia coli]
MCAKKTTEQFIEEAKKRRTDVDFDYSKVNYINNKTKVTIIDPEFGEFDITPDSFLRGSGHLMRGRQKISKKLTQSKEHFISLAKERRTDIDFDYSKVNYINAKTKITIIDPEFGEFDILPNSFLSGINHFARGRMVQKKSRSSSTEQFIEEAKKRRTDVDFDYSKVNYINYHTKITIIDPEFGEFEVTPGNFLSGSGHPMRGGTVKKTTEQFIEEAKKRRTDVDFDYSKVNYINNKTKVTIIDPEFGEFDILPSNFFKGQGHPLAAGLSQKYAYINNISDNGLPVALKYGIEKQKGKRVYQQNSKSVFNVEIICFYLFPTVEQCKQAEKECKKLFGKGILTKREMPDGYTETTTPNNIDKIIAIYEKWGGVKQ